MLKPLAFVAALALASPAFAAASVPGDTDNDGTITLMEAQAAAGAVFDKLDINHEGTLDAKELKGRVSRFDWRAIDPDKDKTVDRQEYLNYVEALFKQADKDSEGTVDAKELRSSAAGRKLGKLIK